MFIIWAAGIAALAVPFQDSSVYLQTDKTVCKIASPQLYLLKGCMKKFNC